MSRYTTTIMQICNSFKQPEDTTMAAILARARSVIFDFDYPFYNAEKKSAFEIGFLRRFLTREIGFETYGLWKLMLEDWLNTEMPYYNKLFSAMELEFNPLHDVDITKTRTYQEAGTGNGTSNVTGNATRSETDTTNESKSEYATNREMLRHSETPQGQLSDIEENKYLTTADINERENSVATSANIGKAVQEASNSSSSGATHTESTKATSEVETITGKQGSGSYSAMLIQYQQAMMDVDRIVYDAMEEKLFMNIY